MKKYQSTLQIVQSEQFLPQEIGKATINISTKEQAQTITNRNEQIIQQLQENEDKNLE